MWLAKLHQDSRIAERHQIEADATLRTSENEPLDILIADVSATGCLFICSEPIELGSVVSVGFAGLGTLEVRIVRAQGSRYGAEFATPLADAAIAAALSEPKDAVVPLPIWQPAAARVEASDVAPEERWPVQARLLVVTALAIACWGVVLAIRSLL